MTLMLLLDEMNHYKKEVIQGFIRGNSRRVERTRLAERILMFVRFLEK